MPGPEEPSSAEGRAKNEDLFRVYIVFVAIATLLSLSLPAAT